VSNVTREEWNAKYAEAAAFMESCTHSRKVLIEVGAQHPLKDSKYPNTEFEARLLRAIELYHKFLSEGLQVEIYVPGSRHMYNKVPDLFSLSVAGKNFLIEKGIPENIIRGVDLNNDNKKKSGVYNAADECYVASSYFRSGNFSAIHSITSPVQLYRKALHYIWFGVIPQMHSVPVPNAYHNFIDEVYDAIPFVRDIDPHSQDEDSSFYKESRMKKVPQVFL
jgi:hypothetical protein